MKSKAGLIALAIKVGPKVVTALAKLVKGLKVGKVVLAGALWDLMVYMAHIPGTAAAMELLKG